MAKENIIAITGSAGHLASTVIPLLITKGYRVRALVYKQEPNTGLPALETVRGSLSDISSLNNLVRDCDAVIHCAARISLNSNRDASVYDTNVNGTMNIFNSAREAGVKRFIHLSSIHAYNHNTADGLLNEESEFCSGNAPRYDQSKRDAQQFVLQHSSDQMEVVVLNPTAVIGPFDSKPSLIGKAIMDIYNRKIPMLINGGFDFCDVRDVASAMVYAIDKGRSGHSYLLGGKWHSLEEVKKIIMNIRGDHGRVLVLPAWAGYLGLPFILLMAALMRQQPLYTKESIYTMTHGNKRISSLKAEKELDYQCRPLNETISDSISWFKQEGYLL